MERWARKVAVVTGASSGIGAATALDLVKANMIVIGLARRNQRVDDLRSRIPAGCEGELHSFKCDLQLEDNVRAAFKWIEEQFGGVDVLVNNAGRIAHANLLDLDNTEKMKSVIDTNVLGVMYCTREAVQSMKKRDFAGHIVIINSVAGHIVPYFANKEWPSLNIYPSTKYAVTAMTEVYRQELQREKSKIKVTSISPGTVKTEILGVTDPAALDEMFKDFPVLQSEDVSAAVLYVLGTPPHVQVHELIIKPLGETF